MKSITALLGIVMISAIMACSDTPKKTQYVKDMKPGETAWISATVLRHDEKNFFWIDLTAETYPECSCPKLVKIWKADDGFHAELKPIHERHICRLSRPQPKHWAKITIH